MDDQSDPDQSAPDQSDPDDLPGPDHLPGPDERGVAPESASVQFRCDGCGAVMAWCPDADALSCEFCGTRREVVSEGTAIREYALHEAGAAATGLGREMRAARCETCGATVAFDQEAVSTACVFCGSAKVLAQEASRNAIRPESVVPLDVGRGQVEAAFRKWLDGLWFRPNALKRLKTFQAVGVYVPHWTFDCDVSSVWTAQAGYYYYVTETYTTVVNGKPTVKTRQVRKVRWVPAAGERDDAFDDLLVLASRGIDEDLAAKLGTYDAKGLVPYRPEYLAGWAAEEYQVTLADGWTIGKQRVESIQNARCAGDVPGDTQRFLSVRNRVSGVRWKHVLLPVWSLSFRWKEEVYPVLVHGQTGRVVGRAPWSWWKIGMLALVLAAAIGAVAVLMSLQ